MGRRTYKKVTTLDTVILYHRYIYRGYKVIAICDLSQSVHPCISLITWDPLRPSISRPLALQNNGTWFTYGWDVNKNVCEVYSHLGYIKAAYSYTPYGKNTKENNFNQEIQYSSEFYDAETDLICYNFRYYNVNQGNWLTRDIVPYNNVYIFVMNNPVLKFDLLGLAHLDHHIDTARKYNVDPKYKSCFSFGNIWPDVPDLDIITNYMDQTQSNISESVSKQLNSTLLSEYSPMILEAANNVRIAGKSIREISDTRQHIIDIVLSFINEDSRKSKPAPDAKQIIEKVAAKLVDDGLSVIPDSLISDLHNIKNEEFKKRLPRTYNSHYGTDTAYHAMAQKPDTANTATYDDFLTKLKGFINKNVTSCCAYWEDLGKALHMITDLHTESHARIKYKNDKVRVEQFYFYHPEDKAWHANKDSISSNQKEKSINLFRRIIDTAKTDPGKYIKLNQHSPQKKYPLFKH